METNEVKRGSKAWLAFAIIFFIGAIGLLILAIRYFLMKIPADPPMGSPGWFDTSSANSKLQMKKASGIALSLFGSFSLIGIGIVCLIMYLKVIQRTVEAGANTTASVITTIREAINPSPKEPVKHYCEYCGALMQGEACKHCGAAKRKAK